MQWKIERIIEVLGTIPIHNSQFHFQDKAYEEIKYLSIHKLIMNKLFIIQRILNDLYELKKALNMMMILQYTINFKKIEQAICKCV